MTPKQIVALAVRLFAIWLAIQVLRMVPWFFEPGAFQASSHVWNTFIVALSAVIVLILWLSPRIIAGHQLTSAGGPPTSADTWLIMGCMLIGLWTLTTTVPRLVYDTIALNSTPYGEDNPTLHYWIAYNLAELCIAAWLIFGAKGVRRVFRWVQNAGIGKGDG
ncbi:MAG TPA: hypothetical protein VGR92_16360 [Steroidobacteraceae bacterium]|nr:hypothetical protein [Steroidobacteraceae bacterium]